MMKKEIISEPKVMRSAAGYYIGTSYRDEEVGADFPNERLSGYYPDKDSAERELDEFKIISHE